MGTQGGGDKESKPRWIRGKRLTTMGDPGLEKGDKRIKSVS